MSSNLILGKNTTVPFENTTFIGMEDSENFRFMEQNIKCQTTSNMVILDVDDHIYNNVKDNLDKKGYKVERLFAFDDTYNPFVCMKTEANIIDFADILAAAISKKDKSKDKDMFWYCSTKRMLINYIMYHKEKHDISELSMKKLYDICKDKSILGFVDENLIGPITASIAAALEKLLYPYRELEGKGVSIDVPVLLVEKKRALFLKMDMRSKKSNLLYTILLSQLFRQTMNMKHQEIVFFLKNSFELPVTYIPDAIPIILSMRKDSCVLLDMQYINDNAEFIESVTRNLVFDGSMNKETLNYIRSKAAHSVLEKKKCFFSFISREKLLDESAIKSLRPEEEIIFHNETYKIDKKCEP